MEVPDPRVLLNSIQQNKSLLCASVENWTVWFGKLEHPFFPENQFFLDSIGNMMLAMPNRSPLYF
jgi:hypothetical protein